LRRLAGRRDRNAVRSQRFVDRTGDIGIATAADQAVHAGQRRRIGAAHDVPLFGVGYAEIDSQSSHADQQRQNTGDQDHILPFCLVVKTLFHNRHLFVPVCVVPIIETTIVRAAPLVRRAVGIDLCAWRRRGAPPGEGMLTYRCPACATV
jgi:hypothetical protein